MSHQEFSEQAHTITEGQGVTVEIVDFVDLDAESGEIERSPEPGATETTTAIAPLTTPDTAADLIDFWGENPFVWPEPELGEEIQPHPLLEYNLIEPEPVEPADQWPSRPRRRNKLVRSLEDRVNQSGRL